MKTTLLLLTLLLTLSTAHSQSERGVAVLDIDEAAKTLGVDAFVKAELAKVRDQLEADLTEKQETLKAQLDGMLKMIGENPTAEQRMQLMNGQRELESEFAKTRREAMEKLSERQTELVTEFREQIKPLAQEEAEAKGFLVVVLKETTFSSSPAADVTGGTIKRAQEAGLEKEVAEDSGE